MTTRLQVSRDYPQGVAVFAAALADPAFHRARIAGGAGEVVSHDATADSVTVVLRQPVPADAVPGPISRLLGASLVITRTERWSLGTTRLSGTVDVVVPLAPVAADGSMTVTGVPPDGPAGPDGPDGGCRLAVDVGVRVTVPLAGALIEPSVVEGIRGLTTAEHDSISAYLRAAGRGGA